MVVTTPDTLAKELEYGMRGAAKSAKIKSQWKLDAARELQARYDSATKEGKSP